MTNRHNAPITWSSVQGFRQDCEYMVLIWDHAGHYKGQWQDDVEGEGQIFIRASVDGPSVEPLTPEEMEVAVAEWRSVTISEGRLT